MIADPMLSAQLEEIEYPSSDGQPMAETGIHANVMILLKQALDDLLESRNANAYVAIDMNWYWQKGNNKAVKAPDLMVILGVGRHERNSFMSWKEGGRVPDLIIEVASNGTWREDVNEKKEVYQQQGVREYFIFDPLAEFLDPQLRGHRLESGYALEADNGDGLASHVLQARLLVEGSTLRLFDEVSRQPVLTRIEQVQLSQERAEQVRQRAEQERQRAEQERQRADAVTAELARLRELMHRAGISDTDAK